MRNWAVAAALCAAATSPAFAQEAEVHSGYLTAGPPWRFYEGARSLPETDRDCLQIIRSPTLQTRPLPELPAHVEISGDVRDWFSPGGDLDPIMSVRIGADTASYEVCWPLVLIADDIKVAE